MTFDSFDFHPHIGAGLARHNFSTPTPIQRRAIPPILEGRDLLGLAQTGTGKTAAFVLPILQRLHSGPRRKLRALVLSPTRELAEQTHTFISTFTRQTGLHSQTIYGGVSAQPQVRGLRMGAEIAVACPGRLLDLMNQRQVDLSRVEVLVIDEADRMFDMGFLPDIRRIVAALPSGSDTGGFPRGTNRGFSRESAASAASGSAEKSADSRAGNPASPNARPNSRQTLLFSATMPPEILSLAGEFLSNPVTIEIDADRPVESISHMLYPVDQAHKNDLLQALLKRTGSGQVLVFTRTKRRASKLAIQLGKSGFSATSLHGDLTQNQRQRAMDGFRSGRLRILVATDIAARGIDVTQISHVINYDLPDTADAYTHRIGRTGRMARQGSALSLVTPDDGAMVRSIERLVGRKLERTRVDGFQAG